jgi:hypothetical protein
MIVVEQIASSGELACKERARFDKQR